MFGSSCETLVHDMSVPDHPILSIYNGHVSGREVGSTMDIMGVGQDLDEEARKTDFVNLYATTPAGQQIKSSTFHMMSDEYNLALGINFDYSSLVFANRILVDQKCRLAQRGESSGGDLGRMSSHRGQTGGGAEQGRPHQGHRPAQPARGVLLPEGGALYFSAAGSLPLYRL